MKKDTQKVKHSIKIQFPLIFIGLMIGTILLCIFMNVYLLEKYYTGKKTAIIMDAYEGIKDATRQEDYDGTVLAERLNNICSTNNITIAVMDANSNMMFVSRNGGMILEKRLMNRIFGRTNESVDTKTLETGEDYELLRTSYDGNDFIEIYGRINNTVSFLMSTPVESIRESAAIANRFFIYVGLFATFVGALIMVLVSKKITKPILELSDISEKMVRLDFDALYTGKSQNEIGLLGSNINKLSHSLEQSISDLKTANNELKKDIERKEEIDEMRKDFLANVSHELKTPIALIQGYAEGLKEGINDDDPDSRNFYCDVIMDEASKMNNMVRKLLTLNQLEFGNDIVNMERFDIVDLIKNYLQSAEILTQDKGITVNFTGAEPVFVWGDEFRVEEVVTNYFSNAVNHCEGEKIIDINIEKENGKAKVTVFNTGSPIPEDSIDHIWEKFYKVDKARTREYGGSGVGLSIVKAIMESMNGRYGVQNFNNGVMFWFELELIKDEQ
ncbi:MAG: HAMP domain-containing protein [Lachnospiraceae bacterium]|nr:HAMP domain-containing protein [Lachnospiraceae bacterium]